MVMKVIFRKADGAVVHRTAWISTMPEGPPFEVELERNVIPRFGGASEDYGYLVIHNEEQAAKAQEVLHAASCELVFQGDEPVDVVCYPRIQVTTDKDRIQADGVDSATITAEVSDPANTDPIRFFVDGQEVGRAAPVNGQAVLDFTAEDPGHYFIEAESLTPGPPDFDLKFGRNGLKVEAVI